jgi:3-oxoacyl-(acyl-carrier-protein) synthase
MVLGEGAGVLVVESEESAKRRGKRILAEITGYGASSDSHHITQPVLDGPVKSMSDAIADAGLEPEDIDYINAHGTATVQNDKNETAAIKAVFTGRAKQIPVVSNKANFGHSIAGSGALELIGCVKSINESLIPPTINYTTPDKECDLDYVTEGKRSHQVEHAMSNSFAFGGSNASLVVSKYNVNGSN